LEREPETTSATHAIDTKNHRQVSMIDSLNLERVIDRIAGYRFGYL
jgi:hypothetical protein